MIFQDPYSSLDPRMTVFDIVKEPLVYNKLARGKEVRGIVLETLKLVGLEERHLRRYPHAFSGGQRQRIGIARSLVCHPKLIVCDEAVSALDVSIQAQILNLLQDLRDRRHLTMVFISHDLAVVKNISDRIAVMYLGKLCELADSEALYREPAHPYTAALVKAIPDPNPRTIPARLSLVGELPSAADPPSGCRFRTRCPQAQPVCAEQEPPLRQLGPGHFAACHFPLWPGPVSDQQPPR
jgi:peptide/nickel transport system ATP-binding protein